MPHPARFLPALIGFLILGRMLIGPGTPQDHLCRLSGRFQILNQACLSAAHLALYAGAVAVALIALTLLLILNWRRNRPRAISYESDAGRWIVVGWFLAVGGAIALLLGLALIGSGGWPLSRQSRHVHLTTGQLPVLISTVQRRYLANYSGAGPQAVCASFGDVTIRNRSSHQKVALDLDLAVTPHDPARVAPTTRIPDRADLNAIARRGLTPHSLFRNPVELDPGEALRRELVFVIRSGADAAEITVPDRDYGFVLGVRDRLTGQRISMPLPSEYRG
jgi:hypothetical protein